MIGTSLGGVALAGLGLGMVHALDADHVMAVSGMSSRRPGLRTALSYAGRWGAGHGLTLLGIGASVLLLGMAVPETLSHYAERAVGAALIVIALAVMWDLRRERALAADEDRGGAARPGPGAVVVGILHGLAGSAPLLAVVPLMELDSPWLGLAYLGVFGLGVVLAMLALGGLLGAALQRLDQRRRGLGAVRLAVASLALVVGGAFLAGG
jgi:cytochrome c biogenesis protein CcdA